MRGVRMPVCGVFVYGAVANVAKLHCLLGFGMCWCDDYGYEWCNRETCLWWYDISVCAISVCYSIYACDMGLVEI